MSAKKLLVITGAILLLAKASSAAVYFYNLKADASVTDIPSGVTSAKCSLWVSDNLPASQPIRGIIGAVAYHRAVEVWKLKSLRDSLTAIMEKNNFALILEMIKGPDDGGLIWGEYGPKAVFHMLEHFADELGRPELNHVPVIWTGLSNSGKTAYLKSHWAPERTIGAVPWSAGPDLSLDYSGAYDVPIVAPFGEREGSGTRGRGIPHTLKGVKAGAPWTPIILEDTEHHRLDNHDNHDYLFAWLRWVIPARLPENISVNEPVALKQIDLNTGYYYAGDWINATGSGSLNWKSLDFYPASQGIPDKVIGWIPSVLVEPFIKRSEPVVQGEIKVHGSVAVAHRYSPNQWKPVRMQTRKAFQLNGRHISSTRSSALTSLIIFTNAEAPNQRSCPGRPYVIMK